MTQAANLANFANNLNTSGQLDPNALSSVVPLAKGGTNASTAAGARTSLDVPKRDGTDATGTWGINISGNAATASNASKVQTTNWTVEEIGTQLVFKYGGVVKFTMDQTNGFTAA